MEEKVLYKLNPIYTMKLTNLKKYIINFYMTHLKINLLFKILSYLDCSYIL